MQKFGGEIDFAMEKFDEFFTELTTFADANPAYQVVVASSMGQKGTIAELVKTRTSVQNVSRLMFRLGLKADEWEIRPAMHPQCNVMVHPSKIQEFTKSLDDLVIARRHLQYRNIGDRHFSLDFGHVNLADDFALLKGEKVFFKELGISNNLVDDESVGTAYHIPEGSLLIYDPLNKASKKDRKRQWSTLSIAPSILENFDLPVPPYMSHLRVPEMVH